MHHKIFAVYDVKVEAYLSPFMAPTLGSALRSFEEAVNDPGHAFSKHPEDFTLFELGEFDDCLGVYSNLNAPRPVGSALEYSRSSTFDASISDEAPVFAGAASGNPAKQL